MRDAGRTHRSPGAVLGVLASLVPALACAPPAGAEVPAFVARSEWVEIEGPGYTIVTDANAAVRDDVVRLLRRFAAVLQAANPGTRVRTAAPTWIYLFRDEAEMDRYRPATIESASAWYSSAERGNLMVLSGRLEGGRRSEAVLHEFVHLYLHANYDAPPGWLNEGLAQYYATCRVTAGGGEVGLPDPVMFAWMGANQPMSLDLLFAIEPTAPAYRQDNALRDLFYAQSFVLVHMLQASPGRAAGFAGFLGRLRAGTRPRLAFREFFPESTWQSLASEVRSYARGVGAGRAHRVPIVDDASATLRERALSTAEALTRLGELSLDLSAEQVPLAAEHFRAALDLDPSAARAVVGLGFAEDKLGHAAAAEQHYRRALASTVSDPSVAVAAGRGTLERLRLRLKSDPPRDTLEAIARLAYGRFRLAMDLEPGDFGAVVGCATSSTALRLRPDTALVRQLEQIAAITPGRPDVTSSLETLRAWVKPAAATGPGEGPAAKASSRETRDLEEFVVRGALDSLNEAQRLTVTGHLTEARGILERIRDRTPGDSRLHDLVLGALRGVEARIRLDRASDLVRSRKFTEAQPLVGSDYPWPDEAAKDAAAHLRSYIGAQIEIERAYALMRAGNLGEARATLTRVLAMDISDEMKSFVRERIRKLDDARAGK